MNPQEESHSNKGVWENMVVRDFVHEFLRSDVVVRDELRVLLSLGPRELVGDDHDVRLQFGPRGIGGVIDQVTQSEGAGGRCGSAMGERGTAAGAVDDQSVVVPVFRVGLHPRQRLEVLRLVLTLSLRRYVHDVLTEIHGAGDHGLHRNIDEEVRGRSQDECDRLERLPGC